ncbi:RNA-binding domain-containing protein [Candidatus Omnitrophota bacterium]
MKAKTSIPIFDEWRKQPEDMRLEFKTARNTFDTKRDLPDYCAALANEGGGKLILGVDRNGKVVGTKAFNGTHTRISHELYTKIKIRVDTEELRHPSGRVLIFHIPGRQPGCLVKSTGKYKYPMRIGESLIEMDSATLKRILNETEPDFSCSIAVGLSEVELSDEALHTFKRLWSQKSGRKEYQEYSNNKALEAAGLVADKGLTYAGLILFGKKENIDKTARGSEIIFEWRQNADSVAYDFRKTWREPFFSIYDTVWRVVNDRNLRIPIQEGLFQRDIYAFNEKAVREAFLNAVAHRDYTVNDKSIFIKASPREFCIESPGGFPPGITPENILTKTSWRNRLIAETLEKAGLVERSGQGMDDIFGNTIKEGKGLPDLSSSDEFSVILKIPAQVKDKNFILFLEKIQNEKGVASSLEEILELERIREQQSVSTPEFKNKFLDLGIIEKMGKTSGSKYILSHKYYAFKKKTGIYTRLSGISRDKQKELIIKHLEKNKKGYRDDFEDIFPELKPMDISNLLQELKKAKRIVYRGASKSGFWELCN